MPGMDGAALAGALRRTEAGSTMPLVLVTSLGRRLEAEDRAAFAATLTKPIKPSQLFDTLMTVLAGRPAGMRTRLQGATDEAEVETAALPQLRILVAEDNPVNQQLAVLLLERAGYRPDVVSNGLEVLDALDRQTYDVVLMDVQMPEMDGLEATRRIREGSPGASRPRIVAVTANAMQGDREMCLAAGVDDYISKPIRLAELTRALARCPAPPEPSEPPVNWLAEEVLDPTSVARLIETLGSKGPALVTQLLAIFFEETPTLLASLRRALDAGEADEARRAAHSLKSNAAALGALRLSSACREVESRTAAGDLTAAVALLPDVEREHGPATEALRILGRELDSKAGAAP
jgi:CheY-like chemotaxis protein